jgi:D-alanyl-lipoteichoic acid acyltransferase DltB (MBOAT superfamily)
VTWHWLSVELIVMGFWELYALHRESRKKSFFFEKKEPKNFLTWRTRGPLGVRQFAKVFAFFKRSAFFLTRAEALPAMRTPRV